MKQEYFKLKPRGNTGGWERVGDQPVLGGPIGTCFDVHVIKEDGVYRMWFSWRPNRMMGHTTSRDGVHWDNPQVIMTPVEDSPWEAHEVNRPTLVVRDGVYHMWYTGQIFGSELRSWRSCIGYATSKDGLNWERRENPVLSPEEPWEGITVMCPHVLWDNEMQLFRMWYSGGRMHESDAIGHATSPDGIVWTRDARNPIFTPDKDIYWEMGKVEACYVMPKKDGWFNMFYLGMDGDLIAYAGLARSRDGITDWERHPSNPVIAGYDGSWDWLGVCKVSVVEEEDGYKLWYNAANRNGEELGLAVHKGFDLGFSEPGRPVENERGVDDFKGSVNYYIHDDYAPYR